MSTSYAAQDETAQDESETPVVEKILVTGKKYRTPDFRYQGSRAVLTQDNIAAWSITNGEDVANMTANVQARKRSPTNASIAIRGVGGDNWHVNANQGVKQFIDEAAIPGIYAGMVAQFDLSGIVIHRGPQNGLYGINSTGGVVQMVSQKPEFAASTSLRAQVGNDAWRQVTAVVNRSLSDNLAARVSVLEQSRDPLWHNLYNNTAMGSVAQSAIRTQFVWHASAHSSWLLSLQHNRNDGSRTPYLGIGYWDANGSNVQNGQIIDLNAAIDCPQLMPTRSENYDTANNCVTLLPFSGGRAIAAGADNWYQSYDAADDVADMRLNSARLKGVFEWQNIDITSVTVLDNANYRYAESLNNNPSGLAFMSSQENDKHAWSQEIHAAGQYSDWHLSWLGGVYYQSSRDYFGTLISRFDNGGAPFGIVPSVAILQDSDTASGFLSVDYEPTEKWVWSTTVRYSRFQQSGTSTARVVAKTDDGTVQGNPLPIGQYIGRQLLEQLAADPAGVCPPNIGGLPCELATPVAQQSNLLGGEISLSYFAQPYSHAYLKLSKGFQAGAFDTRALAAFAGTADQAVAPESLVSLELGWKYDQKSWQLHGALFNYQWLDKQTFDINSLGQPAFLNIPRAELVGLDAQWRWQINDQWQLNSTFGWLSSEISDAGALRFVNEGNQLSHIPKFSHAHQLTFKHATALGLSQWQLTHQYKSGVFTASSNQAQTELEAQQQTNLMWRLTIDSNSSNEFSLLAGARNLFNQKHCASFTQNGSLSYAIQCRPNSGKAQYYLGLELSF